MISRRSGTVLAREGEEAVGRLCPHAAGSAQGVRSQQGSEQLCEASGHLWVGDHKVLLPSYLGWDVRGGMQSWWVQPGTSEQLGAHPPVGSGVSLPVRSTLRETGAGILSPGPTERVRTQDTGLVGSERAWRHQEGWGGQTTASSLLGSCMRLGQLGTAPSPG